MQSGRLEQDGDTVEPNDCVNFAPIQRNNVIAGMIFDVRSRDKGNALSQGLPGPMQHILLVLVRQIVHVTGVHVDGVNETSPMSRDQLPGERVNRDSSVGFVWQ